MVLVYAISLQDQVEKFGAYVGIAAFFGLAVLMVLTFAQAREIKRLREWAGRAPERALELEERVMAQADQTRQVSAQPVRQPGLVPAPATAAAAAAAPAVAAVAHKGTTVHPAAAALPAAATAAGAAKPAAVAAPPAGAPEPATAGNGTGEVPAARTADDGAEATPPVPGASNGVAPGESTPPPAPVARPTAPPPSPPARPAPVAPLRAAPPAVRRPGTGYGAAAAARPGEPGPSRRGTALLIAGAVAALAALAFLATQVIGGDDEQPATPPAARTPEPGASPEPRNTPPVTEQRRTATVAVLNGTTSTGLAASIAERLHGAGYPEDGKVDTGPDQTVAESVVYFADGQEQIARDAARLLDVRNTAPMDADTEALAGPEAKLLVIVGADKAPS